MNTKDLIIVAEQFKQGLLAKATNGDYEDKDYKADLRILMSDQRIAKMIPPIIQASIEKTCEKYSVQVPYYVEQENLLLRQLGFILGKKECSSDEYIQMEIDSTEIRAIVDAFEKNS